MILAPTDETKAFLKLFCLCSRTEAHLYGLNNEWNQQSCSFPRRWRAISSEDAKANRVARAIYRYFYRLL